MPPNNNLSQSKRSENFKPLVWAYHQCSLIHVYCTKDVLDYSEHLEPEDYDRFKIKAAWKLKIQTNVLIRPLSLWNSLVSIGCRGRYAFLLNENFTRALYYRKRTFPRKQKQAIKITVFFTSPLASMGACSMSLILCLYIFSLSYVIP